jgi:hypothetical protein
LGNEDYYVKKKTEAVVVLTIWPQFIAEEKGMTGSWVSCIAITEEKHASYHPNGPPENDTHGAEKCIH